MDPIADALAKIKNAVNAGHPEVVLTKSNIKEAICRILKKEHFIKDYEVIKDSRQGKLKVVLAWGPGKEPLITRLRCISRPGLRKYTGYKDLKPVKGGAGIFILSTPKGLMTDKECTDAKLGGEVICEIW